MDLEDVKDFFKPTKLKIIVALVLLLITPYPRITPAPGESSSWYTIHEFVGFFGLSALAYLILLPFGYMNNYDGIRIVRVSISMFHRIISFSPWLLLVMPLVSYTLSCLAVFLYDKYKK